MTEHFHGVVSHDHETDASHDHPPTTCGHLGTDPAVVRHVVRNVVTEGDEYVLCADCLNEEWWSTQAEKKATMFPADQSTPTPS